MAGVIDRLEDSDQDLCQLSLAVESRFIEVLNLHERCRGFTLIPPASLNVDLIRWRSMVHRHHLCDFRHRVSEKIALRNIAQWTLDLNCELKNQPRQVLEWKD